MRDRTTKVLLFLVFLALVLNAFVMLARPSRADLQIGQWQISAWAYPGKDGGGSHGFYKINTATGEVSTRAGAYH